MATRIEELRQRASQAWDEYATEMARYSEDNLPTQEQAAHIDELRQNATAAQRDLQTAEQFGRDRAAFEAQNIEMRRSGGGNPARQEQREVRSSLGHRFSEMQAFREWLAVMAPNGQFPSRTTLNSPPLHFGGLRDLQMRSELVTGADAASAGALVIPDQYRQITEFGRRPLTIRQIITNLTTNSDSVEFVRITGETNNAAPVPEAQATDSATSGAEPGFKPESGMNFERETATVKTIAHWLPATTRALSDAAQLRGIIDAFLRYGVELTLEDEIVAGTGTGEHFEGILETDGIQLQPLDATDQTNGNFFRTARIAKRKVRTIGRRIPTAYLLNPEDWEVLDLADDENRRFYSDGPFAVMTPRLWGLPVVESEAVPVGTGLVGDFNTCVLWDREQASISVSNSHADFFIRNLVAILCELRAAFGVLKPDAIVAFDTTNAS